MSSTPSALHRIRVWDLPTRLFHWALALAVVSSIATGLVGGDAMVWHFRLGQAALALLLFRLAWGLVGGRWSRFAALPLRPGALWGYLRGQDDPQLTTGHSPVGSLSVLAVLLLLGLQLGTGLVSNDDIAFAGPLSHLVANATVAAATAYHKGWGKLLMLAWVGLHLAALLAYRWRGRALVPAMLHGDKLLPVAQPASRDNTLSRLLALVLLLACAAFSAWVFSLAPAF